METSITHKAASGGDSIISRIFYPTIMNRIIKILIGTLISIAIVLIVIAFFLIGHEIADLIL